MTSQREAKLSVPFLRALLVGAMTLLAGCAALPNDAPVVEQIDEDTGVTIARLGRPVELYLETTSRANFGRFGFLGPFETNQMGKREMFLMIALPLDEKSDPGTPVVQVDGTELTLGAMGRGADFAGLRKSPYKLSTPWIAMFYFRAGDDTIAKLGKGGHISVRVMDNTPAGPVETEFQADTTQDPRLREFAGR
jgi:hypothetical protein